MRLTLNFESDKETQKITVCCEELGLCTFGKDVPEAFEMIGDACAVYWETLEDLGELGEILDVARS